MTKKSCFHKNNSFHESGIYWKKILPCSLSSLSFSLLSCNFLALTILRIRIRVYFRGMHTSSGNPDYIHYGTSSWLVAAFCLSLRTSKTDANWCDTDRSVGLCTSEGNSETGLCAACACAQQQTCTHVIETRREQERWKKKREEGWNRKVSEEREETRNRGRQRETKRERIKIRECGGR